MNSRTIVKQLPVLPPSTYTPALIDFIAPRVIELTYTARDLEPSPATSLPRWAWRSGTPGSRKPRRADGTPRPFVWDEERRFDLRCDLDALYFHLYDISRDDVDYIMETFPIVKRKDEAAYGSYRTKEVILRKYDELAREFVRVMRADLPEKDGSPTGERSSPAARASGSSSRSRYPGTGSGSSATRRWSTPSREPLRPS
jgi:hypothetical protein